MPRSTFYYQQRALKLEDKYADIKKEITKIHHKHHGRYGYRRMTAELKRRGIKLNHKTVYRLMKEACLYCNVRMRKYNSYRGEIGEKAPNLLARDFTASKPNTKWVTDITEFHLFGQRCICHPSSTSSTVKLSATRSLSIRVLVAL